MSRKPASTQMKNYRIKTKFFNKSPKAIFMGGKNMETQPKGYTYMKPFNIKKSP